MNTLVVITGPTGVGKSETAVKVAQALGTEIISADSRQVYARIPVTTAAPDKEQLAAIPHHLVGVLPLDAYFSASAFEQKALDILSGIFERCGGTAVICGGSMMYVDALCNGMDDIPTVTDEIREKVILLRQTHGDENLLKMLAALDPEYAAKVDPKNTKRVMHALEICLQTGRSYTSMRLGQKSKRPFRILKFMLTAPREILFERINTRTLKMIEAGMIDEVRSVSQYRDLNSLNTVGFKEMFKYIDGEWTLDQAVARLQKNTRVYAKKQLTWYARDPDIIPIDTTTSDNADVILEQIKKA
ncbi:MAG: tRNA (adenosine(37)-N6)-dimethylallyltransferase MiaA [Prevotella sp.]|nr:tRNA (adenosine(37)-N6)-dimethylallyltransferase MiaA [Prevotella sp.]MCM1074268.1 tRNA (adenosine(37)-N6)-dimethylallyltransferase MiaA [Ruminococcus sp.]